MVFRHPNRVDKCGDNSPDRLSPSKLKNNNLTSPCGSGATQENDSGISKSIRNQARPRNLLGAVV